MSSRGSCWSSIVVSSSGCCCPSPRAGGNNNCGGRLTGSKQSVREHLATGGREAPGLEERQLRRRPPGKRGHGLGGAIGSNWSSRLDGRRMRVSKKKEANTPLKHPVWSWGAVDEGRTHVYLRNSESHVYEDSGEWLLFYNPDWRPSPGHEDAPRSKSLR